MRNDLKKLVCVVALTLPGAQAFAVDNTVQQAVEKAIMQNPEVMARYHTMRAAENEQSAARGNWLPKVDAQAAYGSEREDYPPAAAYSSNGSWFNHPSASITLRQILFDGFATSNEVNRLGYAKLSSYYDLLSTSDDIALAASQAYADILRYRRLVELASDNWATHKEVFGQIEDRVKAGVGRRADLEQAAGRLALAQSNWLTETSNLHDVIQRYKRLVGEIPPDSLADLPEVEVPLPKGNPLPGIVSANPAFRSTVAGLRSARSATDVRRANMMPNVELQLGQSWDRNRYGISGNYNDSSARVVLNYNLFNGGSDSARIRQANEMYYAAVDLRDKTCRDVTQTATIALNDLKALTEQQQYLDQHALSTAKVRDAYRQQFDIGQRTLLDLLDTENELFEARRAAVANRYNREVAKYRVLAASHGLLPALQLAPMAKEAPPEDSKEGPAEDEAANCADQVYVTPPLDTAGAMKDRPARMPLAATPAAPAAAPAMSFKAQTDTLFAYGQAQIHPSAAGELSRFVSEAANFTIESVTVVGHTDRIGSAEFNQRLSEQRAAAVRDYLISRGMDGSKIRVEGKGASQPISQCPRQDPENRTNTKLVECLKADRRVEINLQGTKH
ncbi:MAG: TolC family outer membrane protein [Betaproteobacteria bacterium]|nr:TolC family outer membrane protein [Betaproteobacteria bacterium]